MVLKNGKRVIPNVEIETQVLVASGRRCCMCYFLNEIKTPQKGQIAHLDRNPTNSGFSNLAYLCLNHHDDFDSTTSQSKGYTTGEVREYRDRLYIKLRTTNVPAPKKKSSKSPKSASSLARRNRNIVSTSNDENQIHQPWKLAGLVEETPLLFAYKSPNRADGICRIERIDLPDQRVVIICEQIDGNPGMSITNAVEYIAYQVCEQFEINPQMLVLIEHYDTWFLNEKEWNLVTFQKMPPKSFFEEPEWKPMTDKDWRSLGIHPRKSQVQRRHEPISSVRRYHWSAH